MPQKTRKRRRTADPEARWPRAERPGQLWALDYQYDQTADGRMLRLLNIVDEFTREALVMRCERSITAEQTVTALQALVIQFWCRLASVTTSSIEPGAVAEPVSFNRQSNSSPSR